MAITGQVLVNRALIALGELAPGETPNSSNSQAALDRLNAIIDNASIQEEMATSAVIGTQTTTAFVDNYTLSTRVVKIVSASWNIFDVDGTLSYPMQILNAVEWNAMDMFDKSAYTAKPTKLFYDRGYPNGKIYLVGTPNTSNGIVTYVAWAAQTQFTVLSTSVTLNPGYELYLITELAIQSAPFFPMHPVSPALAEANKQAKNEIRSLNSGLWGKVPVSEGAGVAA